MASGSMAGVQAGIVPVKLIYALSENACGVIGL